MRTTHRIGTTLLGVGIMCGLAGLIAFTSSRAFVTRARRARGVVVSLSDDRTGTTYATVHFRTADREDVTFTTRLTGAPSRRRVGQKLRVLYLPTHPRRARLDSFRSLWLPSLLFGTLAVAAAVPGLVLAVSNARKRARLRWVKKHGRPVATEFHAVIINEAVSRHGTHPYRIVTRWKNLLTGIHYTFVGPDTWFDPEPFAARRPVIVRIDPRDPACYDMDVSFLPSDAQAPENPDTPEPVAAPE